MYQQMDVAAMLAVQLVQPSDLPLAGCEIQADGKQEKALYPQVQGVGVQQTFYGSSGKYRSTRDAFTPGAPIMGRLLAFMVFSRF
jgi:hypothetical protein